jgi:Arc/MetJ-type ribon-helix-helix transcriptional regulator
MAQDDNRPFAIQLEVEFLDRLSEPVREGKAASVSEIIRTALDRFNLENVVVVRPSQVTISVRLPAVIRHDLKRVAREKHTSIGQLVRAAVETFLPHLESASIGQLEMAMPTSITAEAPAAPARPTKSKRKVAAKTPKRAAPKKPAARKPKPAAKKKPKR